eukprot:TRINITY_DN933_c0_g1_i1.p1 TRINITY_DN933_c0_g1~~TRINITY_DN933_c0_g1_i1.p1  ORF type:complete len:271 (-),score=70.28 TRINITY_DN933_c0_g1_i1:394-1206(-)
MLHHRRGVLDSYGNLIGTNSGLQTSRITRNHGRRSENSSEIDFNLRAHEDDSGISSPPLWKTSPPMTPTTKASTFQYHHLPPTPRSQAIAKGRQELMEMMKGVPESAYELSLKDLVELPLNKRELTSAAPTQQERETKKMVKKKSFEKRDDVRRNMKTGPFLLNMFFPGSLVLKKKSSGKGTCSKVSPKPPSVAVDGEKVVFEKSVDGDWWNKKSSEAEEKENNSSSKSSGSSTSSGSSGRSRQMGGFLPGCFSFFTRKTRAGKHKGYSF